jgi:predicted glycosyltransferase
MFDIFRKPLKVLRKASGGYTGGYWQDGEVSSFMINASVQGTNAEVLQTMPEGARTTACYTLRTDTKLLTATAEGFTPDIVIIDDERFLVTRVTKWQNLPQTKHYEIVVVRENLDAD